MYISLSLYIYRYICVCIYIYIYLFIASLHACGPALVHTIHCFARQQIVQRETGSSSALCRLHPVPRPPHKWIV